MKKLTITKGIYFSPIILFIVFFIIFFSALSTVYVSYLNRIAHNELQNQLSTKGLLQEEWGQLLLQHSALVAYGRVENIATRKLNMEVPTQHKIIKNNHE